MRCSTNLYLFSLACSDTGVVLTGIFLFSLETFRPFSLTVARISGQLSAIVYPMGMIAQTCSVYFTVCAGVDCFVQVGNNSKKLIYFILVFFFDKLWLHNLF